jgi:xylulokinase
MSGRALRLMHSQEAVCLGTAILAGVAIGKYATVSEAVEQVVRVSETIPPDPALADAYKGFQRRYQLLYSSLAGFRSTQANGN